MIAHPLRQPLYFQKPNASFLFVSVLFLDAQSNLTRNQYSTMPGLVTSTKTEEISLLVVLAFAISVFLVATCCVVYLFLRKFCFHLICRKPEKPLESSFPTTEMIEFGVVACIAQSTRTPLRRWSAMSSIPISNYTPCSSARSGKHLQLEPNHMICNGKSFLS